MSDNDLIFPVSSRPLGTHSDEDAGEGSGQRQGDGDSDSESLLSLEDKKEGSRPKFYKETLLSLMADLSMGYDPSTLPQYATSSFPLLWDNMFPGSFNHLLVILFGSNPDMTRCQSSMQSWLDGYLECQHTSTDTLDDALFGSEVEMVRRLVAPLRGVEMDRVFWLNSRTFYARELCEQVECSAKVIEQFQHDLIASLVVPDDHGKPASQWPLVRQRANLVDPVHGKVVNGKSREQFWGLRDYRLEASAATLGWETLIRSSIEFTKFHQYYKAHLRRTNRDKALELGFKRPVSSEFPKFILEGLAVTLPNWPCGEAKNTILDLLFKTALWIGLARGFPALHLFCDIARHFAFCEPTNPITKERACFLRHLVRVRVAPGAIRVPQDEPPFPFEDMTHADRNPAYFIDIAECRRHRAEELQGTLTLTDQPRMPGHMAVGSFEPWLLPSDCSASEEPSRRRNTIAGAQPLDLELKDTASPQLSPIPLSQYQ